MFIRDFHDLGGFPAGHFVFKSAFFDSVDAGGRIHSGAECIKEAEGGSSLTRVSLGMRGRQYKEDGG